jgi:hypothetical protein
MQLEFVVYSLGWLVGLAIVVGLTLLAAYRP